MGNAFTFQDLYIFGRSQKSPGLMFAYTPDSSCLLDQVNHKENQDLQSYVVSAHIEKLRQRPGSVAFGVCHDALDGVHQYEYLEERENENGAYFVYQCAYCSDSIYLDTFLSDSFRGDPDPIFVCDPDGPTPTPTPAVSPTLTPAPEEIPFPTPTPVSGNSVSENETVSDNGTVSGNGSDPDQPYREYVGDVIYNIDTHMDDYMPQVIDLLSVIGGILLFIVVAVLLKYIYKFFRIFF